MNVYSPSKAAWHLDRIAQLREGKDIVPTHIQLIISDLCNQNCFVAGTLIECPGGLRPIEAINVGDTVIGPDGKVVRVEKIGSRLASDVYEVRIGERVIKATGDHPILAAQGWTEICKLVPEKDSVVIREVGQDYQELCIGGLKLERGLELQRIDSIKLIPGVYRVYNFSCPPIEAYIANGVVVHNCSFCGYRLDTGLSSENFADESGNRNPKRFIPTEKAIEILDDCIELGVKAIQFTGGGEPTVHPDHLKIIGYAQAGGLKTALVTNGVRLKDHEVFRNLDWLRISLDAGTEQTYQSVRESKAWNKVIKNLSLASTFTKPVVGVGFVVTRENYTELPRACEIVRDAGIGYIRVSALFSSEGMAYYSGLLSDIEMVRREAAMLQTDRFKVIDLFGDRVSDLDQGTPNYDFCGIQQFTLYLGGDLKVYACCSTSYTDHGTLGDLREQRFADWLKSYRRFDWDAKTCTFCMFNNQNRMINFLLDKEPLHVDFV